MDCIRLIRSEHARLERRSLAPAFHLAVIEEALHYINIRISGSDAPLKPEDRQELRAVCTEALDALADLRGARRNFPE
ncbi:hypothetical protein [Hyphomonas sp.]|uniref:hypothetical protein n=1 Tax=Hyphomonas sp. TaxID=87 RepID=UPI0025BED8A8|nr:hypothetical protein [Hyphomonas sp.]